MKNQILFFAMFSLAMIFAGTNNVFGQIVYPNYVQGTPLCVDAVPLTCIGTATGAPELHPTPGVTYNYEILTNPTDVGSVLWFVTDNNNVISVVGAASVLTTDRDADNGAGDYILDAEDAAYNLATPLATTMDIDISWKNFNSTDNEVLLVAYVTGASGCSDNVQVWRIEPVFNFTLDLLSMFDDGTLPADGEIAEECVSPVESATYDGTNLTMNYGENWVFFSVNAANFVHSWMPDLEADALNGTVTTVEWAYPADAISGTATGWHPTTDPVLASAAAVGGVVGAAGECIVVRVQIVNAAVEAPLGTTPNTVTLSADGIMYNPTGTGNYTDGTLADMDNSGTDCVNNITDEADYTILPRPEITEVNPTTVLGPFEPKN